MNRFHFSKLTFLLATLLALVLMTAQVACGTLSQSGTSTPLPSRTSTPLPSGTWTIVNSPNGSLPDSVLNSVAVVSAKDVWAAGVSNCRNDTCSETLIEHWNGSQWSVVTSPNAKGTFNATNYLAVISANDIWAVGGTSDVHSYNAQTLIEHWNGSQWSIVTSPNPGSHQNDLNSSVAISKKDVWAVGDFGGTGSSIVKTMVLHWNGSQWSTIQSPSAGSLYAVTAVSKNDIWAVGVNGSPSKTLIEHWNGARWSVVTSPNVGTNDNVLGAVTAVSANDIWAVGGYEGTKTLIEHWNGARWSVVTSPNVGPTGNFLGAVTAISASDIWAVGGYLLADGNGQTLIEHWNGTRWSVVASPNGSSDDFFNNVAAGSANDIWAVGGEEGTNTLIAHCC
jgi:hypothetical protein